MLKIVKANQPMVVERINLCFYAAPGLGKTTLGFTAESPLCLDFDHGSYRAFNRKDTVAISSWQDVTNIHAHDLEPYKTVVVDTAGRALDFLTQDIIQANPKMGRAGALTLQGFGELKAKFTAWLKALNAFGKDVVLLAHMSEERSGDDVIERLDIQGSSKGEIYKVSDAMGRIIINPHGERMIDFSPRPNSFGKNPAQFPVLPFQIGNDDTLAKIITGIKEAINHISAQQKEAQAIIQEWNDFIRSVKTPQELNENLEDLKKAPQAVKRLAAQRAKDLGFVFNNGEYEVRNAVAQ